MFKLLLKVVSDLVVFVILEWNKLDTDMRNSTSINIFKKPLLQFVRPSPKSLFNCHIPKSIKCEIRSRLDLSHSREHRFKHSFQDTLNPICDCGCEIEATALPLLYQTKNNWNFTKTLFLGDPLNNETVDTLTLLLQMLLLTLF